MRSGCFAAQAELVTVDVVVLGPDGKTVSGLTRDDFVVKEDGRPQAIAAFEAVEALVPGLEAPETVRFSPSQARVATNVAGPPTRRTFAVVFDDMHVGDLDMEQAKSAVGAFAERQARPGDRLVLFTTSDARFWATTRGAEDRAFAEALRRVRSHQRRSDPLGGFPMTHYEALRIEEANDDAVMGAYGAHLSFVAFVKDVTGRPIVRLSQDWPIEGKLDEAGRVPQANLVLRRTMSPPAGRYTVESAIQDRKTGRISVVRTPVDIAPASSDGAR